MLAQMAISHRHPYVYLDTGEQDDDYMATPPAEDRQVRRGSALPPCGSPWPHLPALSAIGHAAGVFADPK
jgi:hypothetical protein